MTNEQARIIAEALTSAAQSQERATLMLAEQQRVANMISLARLHGPGSDAQQLVMELDATEFAAPGIPAELLGLLTAPLA